MTKLVGVDGQIRRPRARGEVSVGGGLGGGMFRHMALAAAEDRIHRSLGHCEVSADGGRSGGLFR